MRVRVRVCVLYELLVLLVLLFSCEGKLTGIKSSFLLEFLTCAYVGGGDTFTSKRGNVSAVLC